jgi:hypothetical protein
MKRAFWSVAAAIALTTSVSSCGAQRRLVVPSTPEGMACTRQCEQIWWQCSTARGCERMELLPAILCRATCNGERDNCLTTCPGATWVQEQNAGTSSGGGTVRTSEVEQFRKEQAEQDQRDRETLEEKLKNSPISLKAHEMASLCRSWGQDMRACMESNGFKWSGLQWVREAGPGVPTPSPQSTPAAEHRLRQLAPTPTKSGKRGDKQMTPAERLRQLDEMHRDGLIRNDEYEQKRKDIIDNL